MTDTLAIGKDIDSWCGPCKRIATHTLIAIIDGAPKQVICQSCRDRHNFRLPPAAAKPAARPKGTPRKLTSEEREVQKRQDDKSSLAKELAAATDVRPFVRRETYKNGQVIDHPEYGRGKIENARRDSLLVRFNSGLKSILIT